MSMQFCILYQMIVKTSHVGQWLFLEAMIPMTLINLENYKDGEIVFISTTTY